MRLLLREFRRKRDRQWPEGGVRSRTRGVWSSRLALRAQKATWNSVSHETHVWEHVSPLGPPPKQGFLTSYCKPPSFVNIKHFKIHI